LLAARLCLGQAVIAEAIVCGMVVGFIIALIG
jgi:hypothetical protein